MDSGLLAQIILAKRDSPHLNFQLVKYRLLASVLF